MGRSAPLIPPSPRAAASTPNYPAPGGYPTPNGYPAPGGYGAPAIGYGMGDTNGMVSDPNRKLQPGDQLSFAILQDREPAVPVMVSQTGDLAIEPLPQTVRVAGKTLSEATNEIKRELEKDYYFTATVRLNLDRASISSAGQISLSGSVNRQGALPLFADRPTKVSQAILAAGGFSKYADERRVRLTRVNKDGKPDIFIVDVKSILQEGKVDRDMVLQDGDQIYVKDTYFKP